MLPLVLALMTVAPSFAGETWTWKAQVDLNRDGTPETVALKPFTQDGVRLGQLVVLDRRGRVLWAGPRRSATPQLPSEPLVFGGEFDLGEVEVAGDLDGDGAVELLGTYQQSDVRPTRFRLLRWTGDRFIHVRSGCLVPADQRPGTWVWKPQAPDASSWILGFRALLPDGTLRAQKLDFPGGEEELLLRATPEGFQVAR